MSLLIQPLTRLVSRGAALLILLGTVLIPFDDLADPLQPGGHRVCQSLSEKQELGRLACLHFVHANLSFLHPFILR